MYKEDERTTNKPADKTKKINVFTAAGSDLTSLHAFEYTIKKVPDESGEILVGVVEVTR